MEDNYLQLKMLLIMLILAVIDKLFAYSSKITDLNVFA